MNKDKPKTLCSGGVNLRTGKVKFNKLAKQNKSNENGWTRCWIKVDGDEFYIAPAIFKIKEIFDKQKAKQKQDIINKIEERLITRLGELRFAGMEDICDRLSDEIKEIISDLK